MKVLQRLGFPSSQRLAVHIEHQPKRQRVVTVSDSDSKQEEKFYCDGIAALASTYHSACSEEMVRAYDQLVKLDDSNLLRETKPRSVPLSGVNLRHFRIYVDDGPGFDFIGEG
jgi:hypothetical protein